MHTPIHAHTHARTHAYTYTRMNTRTHTHTHAHTHAHSHLHTPANTRINTHEFCWVEKYININIKPTSTPTQRQANPRKNRFKVAFWAALSHSKRCFRGLGLVLYRKQTTRNPTQPKCPQTLYCFLCQNLSLPSSALPYVASAAREKKVFLTLNS